MARSYAEIELTQGYVAIVDRADLADLSKKSWYASPSRNTIYARNDSLGRMHRYLLSPPAGVMIDHKNGDGLDNRRSNLRLATHSENMHNSRQRKNKKSCPYRGVMRGEHKYLPWDVRIWVNGRKVRFGRYKTAIQAALAYDAAIISLRKEFGFLNFPERYNIKQRRK